MSSRIGILLAVLLIGAAGILYLRRVAQPAHPNVLFIVLDTTRADHLGVYGYERDTSPALDSFARENTQFRWAMTASPWTPPSVATMFSGLYPVSHGVMPPNGRDLARQSFHRLSDSIETIAEFFKKNGYRTSGITPNPWCKEEFNYQQGFDTYQFLERETAGKISTEAINQITALKDAGDPFFLYVHYLDPHDPYKPPDKFRMFDGPLKSREYDAETLSDINLYDGEIRYMDATIAKVFNHLRTLGLYDDMKILIVGDHGEQFREWGDLGHGFKLHNEELHVPLLVRDGKAPRTVDFTVSTVDVYPTLIDLAGLPIPPIVQGVSLLDNENSRDRVGVLSEIRRKFNYKSITTFEGRKLIVDFESLEYEGGALSEVKSAGLFDRKIDPSERKTVEDEQAVKELLKDFDALYRSVSNNKPVGEDTTIEVTDETVKQLKSLGYLQ